MHIAFITSNYPSPIKPTNGTFVQQFVSAMARQGHECSVINPITYFDRRFGTYPSRFKTEGESIRIYRPLYLSCSSIDLSWAHTGRWTNSLFSRSVLKSLENLPSPPDLLYGHFLYPAGHAAICAAKEMRVPSVVGVGEGEFWTVEPLGFPLASIQMQQASAFLSVSTCIAEELTKRLEIPPEKIEIFPNGVDPDVFHPRDRFEMCKDLGISPDTFNIGYVGPFIAQKGYPKLLEAVEGLDDVKLVLLGRGTLPPQDSKIVFSGSVPHSAVANYLGACDIFVLPSIIEGSCNSVIEAMACGLPIVTSNGRYMDDIVDDEVAFRVDPTNVPAIREAIIALKNNPELRKRMSEACLRKAKQLDINERALRVTKWINEIIRQTA